MHVSCLCVDQRNDFDSRLCWVHATSNSSSLFLIGFELTLDQVCIHVAISHDEGLVPPPVTGKFILISLSLSIESIKTPSFSHQPCAQYVFHRGVCKCTVLQPLFQRLDMKLANFEQCNWTASPSLCFCLRLSALMTVSLPNQVALPRLIACSMRVSSRRALTLNQSDDTAIKMM